MKVYRDLVEDGVLVSKEIFDIAECTYTGKDMGERSITATIEFATPIDFQIGDYIKLPMQNLIRSTNGVNGSIASGSDEAEKFYIYTMPTIKKVARAMSNGKAFEHNVTFQSAQYELSCVQMRDLGNSLNADSVIYTGFDNVTFNGAAHELMERIMMVLKEAYHDSEGNPLWSYEISDTVNEDVNLALERFPISFSGNTVMDALLELNNKETINTTFFINNRKIYVGFKRPYFCRVTDGMSIDTNPSSQLFTFQYGKTSDKGVALQYGGLYDITKTVGREVPITKLFAYGASRNLNRYYCSDRVKGGRYVNRLMLPSFDADGKTDFIVSEDALQRYGVREATKQFEEIYPSIRYATYGDIRQVKYCIKVKASGRSEDIDQSSYPIARIQCYKVVESEITGVNKLVEAAPPDDLAIYIHAMDKTVKVVLYGGATDEEAIAKQKAHDTHVPTRVYSGAIPGSCFIVHDRGFDEAGTAYENADRSAWFTSLEDLSGFTEKQKEEIKLNQINYTDTFWLTDLYIFQDYEQTYFSRDGYSAWSWARLNNKYSSEKGHIASDSVVVNEIVHVEPITISDTNMTADGIDKRQSTFDIYLRDLGFTINEQNDFGDMVFLQNGTVKVSILDGLLAGQEFEISGSINSTSPSCICAFNDDGTRNEAFFEEPDYTTDGTNPQTPYDAFEKGAIWRIRLNRTNVDEADYANLNLAMPTKEINARQGDHLVLLDIFMPDIYIHAAENRLLREARKYLEANDNGSISYSVNFDKVRMQQIPNYALQMREGLNLRVVDEDLNIRTENNGRYIADYRDNKVFSSTESDYNRVWLSANTPIDFTRGKYYTIEFELNDDSSFDTSATNAFALLKTKNDATIAFNPSYSVNKAYLDNGKIAVTIKFNLPDNFDDSSIYYPSLLLVSEISSNMRMYSHWLSYVFERDFDENTNILNYADFTIDSLTIKITDNSGNNEPIREITATLSEQTNATAWATLMNKVATTAKEGAQNKKALEEVVNTARKNYQALLSLKDSIFDPDGSCDQVFLQVMMQQVGADSMNYQLDNTRSGLGSDGQPALFNCSCERGSDGYYHFKVYNNDTLRHYVYTQGSQAGNWEIPVGATGVDVQLNGTESYFVCLKCPKNDTVGQWICSTKQYAVNDPEDDTCWFFNWAILTVDSGGVYTLMETRGNAYMYGDNLVCGKISTMAGNSYFDLTHGNFVLGDGTGPALSYINGVLTISGSKGDAEETLRQLGILQDDVENLEIGGKNLIIGSSTPSTLLTNATKSVETLRGQEIAICNNNGVNKDFSTESIAKLQNNKTYTLSFDIKSDVNYHGSNIVLYFYNKRFSQTGLYIFITKMKTSWGTEGTASDGSMQIPVTTEWKKLWITYTLADIAESEGVMPSLLLRVNSSFTSSIYIANIKLEQGTKATDWTPAPEDVDAKVSALDYLKAALTDGSTEITGGLTMTNVLMLKNLAGSVTAGMSGLTTHNNKEDKVLMWGGGTYEEAYAAANNDTYNTGSGTITTLLKKDGTGKIGIFKISDTQAVVDVPNQGKVIIDASTTNGGIRVLNSSGRINAALLPTSISSFKPLANNSVIGGEQSVYYSMSNQSVTSTSKTIALSRMGSFTTSGTTTETLEQYTKETTITTASTRVGGNTVTLNGNIGTNGVNMFVVIKCELVYNDVSLYSIQYTDENQSGQTNINLSNVKISFPNSFSKSVTVSNSLGLQLKITIFTTNNAGGGYINSVSMNVSMGSIYMYYKAYTSTTYTYSPQTIIGTDGLISLVSNSQYFMVDNSGKTQKIYAKGLQETKPTTTGNGELYVSNYLNTGLVKALYDGFSAISEVLEKCKYEGSNAKAQENAKNACTNIRTQLAAISIIANS